MPTVQRIRQKLAKMVAPPGFPPDPKAAPGANPATTPPPAAGDTPEVLAFKAASTERALERLTGRGHTAASVIDVGASNGMWSAVTERYLPNAKYLLIEAQECHRGPLTAYCNARPNAEFTLAAAGATEGSIFFDDSSPFGGLASEEKTESCKSEVPVVTIDAEVERRGMPGPYLIKLDTHGFEVPILEGAAETMKNASMLIIEVYNFQITDSSLRFWEMCNYLADRGFYPADISEPLWRAHDQAFWQIDMIFVPKTSAEFDYIHYE